MGNGQSSVAMVVASLNRRDLLRINLVQSQAQTRPIDEIIVVNNGSDDGTAEMLRDEFPTVTVVEFEKNIGNVSGITAGMERAFENGHDWIWVTDDDASPKVEALEKLLEAADTLKGEKFYLRSFYLDPTEKYFSEPIFVFVGDELKTFDAYKDAQNEGPLLKGQGGSSQSVMVSRAFCAEYGFFAREGYFGSDFEYYDRMRLCGYQAYFVRDSIVHHRRYTSVYLKNPLSFLKLKKGTPDTIAYPVTPDWKQYYMIRNAIYYQNFNNKTYNGNKSPFRTWVKALMRAILTAFFAVRTAENKFGAMKFSLLGIWDGLLKNMGKRYDPQDFQK